jgi:hypothetical protein
LIRFLFNNKDVFAWSANDLCGVNRDVIEHSLNVDPSFRPRKQRLRKMSDDKAEGARNKVKRLLSAGVIREVKYPEWLANTVMVKKANGKWRMCIDFTDLNKACPKNEFPLPRIDSLVDAAASSELMSLLDCYSGYHQIWMKKEDEPKTSFITPSGTYCYLRMPEGLKNAGGSFSRMTAKVLHSHIDRNVLTYVDDIIAKSTKQENHITDLQETFANFRQAGLKLNTEKYVFGVKKGKFLGCLVSTKGIEANPSVGAKAKTPPFAQGLRCSRWSNGDKTGRDTLRPIRHQTKACDEVTPPCGLVQLEGPRVIRPIVTGPAWPLRVTGLLCKGIPVITVCNPALWEYSGDNLGV